MPNVKIYRVSAYLNANHFSITTTGREYRETEKTYRSERKEGDIRTGMKIYLSKKSIGVVSQGRILNKHDKYYYEVYCKECDIDKYKEVVRSACIEAFNAVYLSISKVRKVLELEEYVKGEKIIAAD
jgi:hypothetical protein